VVWARREGSSIFWSENPESGLNKNRCATNLGHAPQRAHDHHNSCYNSNSVRIWRILQTHPFHFFVNFIVMLLVGMTWF